MKVPPFLNIPLPVLVSFMWNDALTPKSFKYYAIAKYANPEKTWTAYFKAVKNIEALADAVNKGKAYKMDRRALTSLGNGAGMAFSKEAVTRMCAALTDKKHLPEMKTLLEWLGLLWRGNIPEADFQQVPFSIEMADRLTSRD